LAPPVILNDRPTARDVYKPVKPLQTTIRVGADRALKPSVPDAANPHLRAITAALDTSCRQGELLSMQWH
jgi:hypothetical protein